MAEISYPFDAENSSGGSPVVSQTQWQAMALQWGHDHIDFPLANTGYTGNQLPFVLGANGRTLTIGAGSASVGGFYYQLSGSATFTIAANSTGQGRIDLIVLRADMSKSAVNMAVVQGTPAATPVEPKPVRRSGGIWEMPLYAVTVPANNGSLTTSRRGPYPLPGHVAFPWDAGGAVTPLPRGAFAIDLDNDVTGTQAEAFVGRDSDYVWTRDFTKSRTYTPNLLNVSGTLPAGNRKGRWRWIAPNTYWFSITVVNDYEDRGIAVSGSNWRVGVSLPITANSKAAQTVHGLVSNPYESGGLPNLIAVTAITQPGASGLYLQYPSPFSLASGLDGLSVFPARSTFSISGVLEANQFNE